MTAVSPMRVLVVDDCTDTATTLAMLLKHFGHEASIATGGEAALQQAPIFRPDAMFIDLAMPQIDGLSVAKRLRSTREFAKTPLVAVSGYVDDKHRTEAAGAGFCDFLAKPYTLAELQATMERVAQRTRVSQELAQAARLAAEKSRQRNQASRQGLNDYWQSRRSAPGIPVSLAKSGTSRAVSLFERSAAEELRRWLKLHRCRVGPVFEASPGCFTFFVYSRRLEVAELIGQHGRYRVDG